MTPTTTKLIEEKIILMKSELCIALQNGTSYDPYTEVLRSSLLAVAEKARKEGFEEAVEKVREELKTAIFLLTPYGEYTSQNMRERVIEVELKKGKSKEQQASELLSDLLASLKTREKKI